MDVPELFTEKRAREIAEGWNDYVDKYKKGLLDATINESNLADVFTETQNIIGGNAKVFKELTAEQGLNAITQEQLTQKTEEANKAAIKFNKSIESQGLKGKLAGFGKGLLQSAGTTIALTAAFEGVKLAAGYIDDMIVTSQEAQEELNSMSESYSQNEQDIASLNAELETTATRIDELSVKENLTFTEESELIKLQAQNDELERTIELKKAQKKIDAQELVNKARQAYDKRTQEETLFGEGTDFSYDEEKISNFRNDTKNLYGSKENIDKIKHNATASWWDQDVTTSNYRDLSAYENNINMLIGTYKGLEDSAASINEEIENLSSSNMTEKEEKEALALEAELKKMDQQKTDVLGMINSYATDLSTIYSSFLAGEEAGILSPEDSSIMVDIQSILSDIGKITNSGAKSLTASINNIFAKADFEGVKDQLIGAGKEGEEALSTLIGKVPGLSAALDEAGVSAEDLKQYIMAIADPDAVQIDKVIEKLKKDFTNIDDLGMDKKDFEDKVEERGDIIDKFLADKSDEEIDIFYNFVKANDLDLSGMEGADLEYNFGIALEGADGVSQTLYDITSQIETIGSLVSSIEKINSILSETQTGKSIGIEDFNSAELADYRGALEYVNGSMQINAEMAEEITKAKTDEALAANDAAKAYKQSQYLENADEIAKLQKQLQSLNETSAAYRNTQDRINELLGTNSTLEQECAQYDLLSASILEATGAYQEWLNAQSAPESGDMYDDAQGAMKALQEGLESGKTGTKKFEAAMEFLIPEDVPKDEISGYMEKLNRYLGDSDAGTDNFLADAVENGLMTLEDEVYKVADGIDMIDFVEKLHITPEMARAIFGELEEYDFEFDWSDENISSIPDAMYQTQTDIDAIQARIDEINGKPIKTSVDYSELQYLNEELEKAKQLKQDLSGQRIDTYIDLDQQEADAKVALDNLFRKQDAGIEVDQSEILAAQRTLEEIQEQKAQLGTPTVIEIEAEISNAQSRIEELQGQIQYATSAPYSPGTDHVIQSAQTEIDTLNSKISTLQTLKIEVESSSVDTAQTKVDDLNNTTLNDKSFTVTANATQAIANLGTVVSYLRSLQDKEITVTTNKVTRETTVGAGEVTGTAQASGTAKVRGDWGNPVTQKVLIGELGREVVVDPNTGKWRTYGDNGAEFATIPKNAIVFNHKQTEDLLERGFVNGRGMIKGTAFVGGNAKVTGGGGKKKYPQTNNNTTASSSKTEPTGTDKWANNVSKAGKDLKNSTQDAADTAKDFFDWVQVKLDRIQWKIDAAMARSENTKGYKGRNSHVDDALKLTRSLITYNKKGQKEYEKQAKKVAAKDGLSSKLQKQVRNGTIDISTLDDKTKEKVENYKQWYDLSKDCELATIELRQELEELAQTKLDNIEERFDGILSHIEHSSNMINEYMDQAETKGYNLSSEYYTALIGNEEKSIGKMEAERDAMIKSFKQSVKKGDIKENSYEWNEMKNQIEGVSEKILEAKGNVIEYQEAIRQLEWDQFDKTQEAISRIVDESDFLIDLMSNDDLFNEKGMSTSQGDATMGLHGTNYNVYMEQANRYRDEMNRINAQLANDTNNQKLLDRRNELLDAQRESILAAEDEKQAMIDLVEEGISKQLEYLDKVIDKYKEALDSQKDLYDYQKNVSSKADEVATLQKQLDAYAGDTSEESKANIQKLQESLKEAQNDLKETEYDKYVSDQKELLDDLRTEYEEVLNSRLDNVDQLMRDLIAASNTNAGEIKATLSSEAASVGSTLTQEMQNIWGENGNGVMSAYSKDFSTRMTGIQTTINAIAVGIQTMVEKTNKEAAAQVNQALNDSKNVGKVSSGSNSSSGTSGSGDKGDKGKKDDKIVQIINSGSSNKKQIAKEKKQNHSNLWEYIVKNYGHIPTYAIYSKLAKELKIKLKGDKATENEKNKILDKLVQKGYSSGTRKATDDWAWTQENGKPEMIIRASDGAVLTPVNRGAVFNANATNTLYDFANAPKDFMKNLGLNKMFNIPVTKGGASIESHGNQFIFNLENVTDYQSFMQELKRDPKFEAVVQSMTVDRAAGRSHLNKYKGNM